jgi:beta-lactamase class A
MIPGATAAALLALLAAPEGAVTGKPPDLRARLQAEGARAGGTVAVSVVHIPSGRSVSVDGGRLVPLYSVYKLPVAITVLAEVQAGRLALDRKVEVTAADVAPGAPRNSARWKDTPVTHDVRRLLELSLVDSDNTANDKLLALAGGPAGVRRHLGTLGLHGLDIRFSSRQQAEGAGLNRGSAEALTRLLARVQQGTLVPSQRALLLELMGRSTPGLRRLRGGLPPGTPVFNKTGTGAKPAVTNDIGLVTLPGGDTLAIAVLISGSPLPPAEQEAVIAGIARLAYDAFTVRTEQRQN